MTATAPHRSEELQHLLRDLAPQVLGALVRRFADFGACEDAVQEALIAASAQWPRTGSPINPRGWLLQVASRRLTDQVRAETARRRREEWAVSLVPPEEQLALAPDAEGLHERDDSLDLLFMCCHPALTPSSAIALTLRAVGGLTTAEIARAFFVPEATLAQRISRAKQTIREAGAQFSMPEDPDAFRARLGSVMHALYLIFNEGYAASGGGELTRTDLSNEAIRLTRMLLGLVPNEPEVEGLLALMLLTDARRDARTGPDGELIPLDEQDRSKWNRAAIAEGTARVSSAFSKGSPGPYQVQAAIAALHDEAPTADATDWPQILELYGVLHRMDGNPMVALNEAIAFAMVHGPAAGLERVDALASDPRLVQQHRVDAVRAHLLERLGDLSGAADHYRRAAGRTASTAERDYLLMKAAKISEKG